MTTQQMLESLENNKPKFASTQSSIYQSTLDKILQTIMNREDFEYNADEDPLYKQAEANAQRNGKRAMQESMGTASTLTGGYLNSYAATAGSQAYNRFIQDLAEKVLDYRNNAYKTYTDKSDEYKNQATLYKGLLSDMQKKYTDEVDSWEADRSYYQDKLEYEEKKAAEAAALRQAALNTKRSSSSSSRKKKTNSVINEIVGDILYNGGKKAKYYKV